MPEALAHLWSNVGRRPLLRYIAAPVAAALVLSVVPIGDTARIVVYGLVTLGWALLFARKWGPVPGRAADFWYYVLGATGVVLFFIAAADQRSKVTLTHEFAHKTAELEAITGQRSAIETIEHDSPEIFATIRRFADINVRSLDDPLLRDACNERDIEKRNDLLRRRDAQAGVARPFTATGNPVDYACENLTWLPVLKIIAEAKNLDEVLPHIRGANSVTLRSMIGVDFRPLGFDEAITYLGDKQAATAKIHELQQHENSIVQRLKEISDVYGGIGRRPDPGSSGDIGALQYFLWPYFILAALGLKLARVDYCGAIRVD